MKLIVEADMPRNCAECQLKMDEQTCFNGRGVFGIEVQRMPWCPIKGVLPEEHGRLGDLDELAAGCDDPYWCRWLSEIEDAPTIVPAERKDNE